MQTERIAIACGVLTLASAPLPPQQAPIFRGETRTVPIYATVSGPDGRLLPDLTRDDFTVLDNGQVRPLSVFSADPAPIVGLAVFEMGTALKRSRTAVLPAALAFVDALWQEDRVRLATFDWSEISVSPILTGNKATLRRIVQEDFWFSGGVLTKPLWATVTHALDIVAALTGRRVLLVLTAGQSSWDPRTKQDAVRQLQHADAMIYAVGFTASGLARDIRELAEESGGGYAVLPDGADLQAEFRRIVAELHHQYLIGFVSDATDGSLRTLEVRVNVPGAKVRARRSYVAAGPR